MHWRQFETEKKQPTPFSIFQIVFIFFSTLFQVWKTSLQISVLCIKLGLVFVNTNYRSFHFFALAMN